MKAIFSLKKHSYLKAIGTFIIAIALIAGVVGCEGEGEPDTYNLTMAVTPAGGGTAVDVTGAAPYEEDTDVSIEPVGAGTYAFDPYPFDKDGIEVTFNGRYLAPIAEGDDVRDALERTPVTTQTVTLVAAA